MNGTLVLVGLAGLVVVVVMVLALIASRYNKVGLNEALIISERWHKRLDGTEPNCRIVKRGTYLCYHSVQHKQASNDDAQARAKFGCAVGGDDQKLERP